MEYAVDRVDTMSTVFLGVTLGCARCHNHKYDPFTQREYYQMFAYFNNIPELGRYLKYGNTPPLREGSDARAGGEVGSARAESGNRGTILQDDQQRHRIRADTLGKDV